MTNPLSKHYRQPQLWITLPSLGKFYPEGTIDYPQSGEVPVYSMTAKDEILFKSPDALLNGEATKLVIESCVPAIKNAWMMPAIDIDAILIAIRRATYGNEMEFSTNCPHCETVNDSAIDLSVVSDAITIPDYSETLEIQGLRFVFRPLTYLTFNQTNLENFKRQQNLAVLADESLTEEQRRRSFSEMFVKIVNDNMSTIAEAVDYIITDEGERVTDHKLITEFFENCDGRLFDQITKHIEQLNERNRLKPLKLQCSNPQCGKTFQSTLTFEQSNFFV